jgi:protein-tyrosine phosphatase
MDVKPMESAADVSWLEGASNFRDFGDHPAGGGRRVRTGHLFRSNKLSGLTAADQARLTGLGIRTIFDLRLEQERQRDPTAWSAPGLSIETFPPRNKRRLVDMALEYPATQEGALALMHDFYAEMPHTMTHMFGTIFRRLADGGAPCIIHCSAGKDRTGLAAALLLAALGVDRETIVADYAFTDRTGWRNDGAGLATVATGDVTALRGRYPPEAAALILAAAPTYIEAALDSAEARYGSLDAYFETALEVPPTMLESLRDRLLVP